MAKLMFGNHSAVRVRRAERARIRDFYRDVLGCKLTRQFDDKDDFRIGDDFHIAFLYESGRGVEVDQGVTYAADNALSDDEFLKAIFLELKANDVDEMRQQIVAFGVKVLDVPDVHLYFQAPGGQVFRLVGTNEDLSRYEGIEPQSTETLPGDRRIGAHKSAAKAVPDVTRGMLLATIEIAAPPERVFRAVTSEEVVRWWGSVDTYRTTRWTGDVRVGGAWRADYLPRDGKPFSVHSEFLELDPPRLLVQTWRYDRDPSGSVTTIKWRFEPTETGTRVVVRHEGFGDALACENHAVGWERVLGWLSDHFQEAA